MERIEVCNIWKSQCYVDLKQGHELCPMCNGHGAKFLNASFKQRHFTVVWCKLCLGEGKVDWIAAITKKQFSAKPSGFRYRRKTKDIKMRCIGPKHCKKGLKRLWMNNKRFCDPFWEIYVLGKEL